MSDIEIPTIEPFTVGNVPNVAPDQPIASAWGNTVADDVNLLLHPTACRVYHNAAQPVANNALTVLAFNSEYDDAAGMHDPATQNSRITISRAGRWDVNLNVSIFAAGDYVMIEAFIRRNGTDFLGAQGIGSWTNATDGPSLSVFWSGLLVAGAYLEGAMFQLNSASAARNTIAGSAANQYACSMSAVWRGLT